MSEIKALQAALAAEQAVVYGYGVVGAHLKGKDRSVAAARLAVHAGVRDKLEGLITAAGATPAAAQPAYQLPFPVEDETAAKQLAAHLEDGAVGATWDLVASTAARSATRELAVDLLSQDAVFAARWGAPTVALPGRPS